MIDTSSSALPALANQPSCHDARSSKYRPHWRHRLFIVGGAVASVGLTALAIDQRWLSLAALTPLFFTLPCAVMMFTCMRGMGGRKTPTEPT